MDRIHLSRVEHMATQSHRLRTLDTADIPFLPMVIIPAPSITVDPMGALVMLIMMNILLSAMIRRRLNIYTIIAIKFNGFPPNSKERSCGRLTKLPITMTKRIIMQSEHGIYRPGL